jgi:Zn-dependent protease
MTLDEFVRILFQLIAFLFAISVHESAHAWTANRCGDPTARMLGRITLNPIKHIDLFGTVVVPLLAWLAHFPVIGWAKPTPVDPRNFKNPILDDILTAAAGPISNFIVAAVATLLLVAIGLTSSSGRIIVEEVLHGIVGGNSPLVPASLLLFAFLEINVLLAVFNLIPVPPLDGSHVLRHFLSDDVRRVYDTVGVFGLMALVFFAPQFLMALIQPVLNVYIRVMATLMRI